MKSSNSHPWLSTCASMFNKGASCVASWIWYYRGYHVPTITKCEIARLLANLHLNPPFSNRKRKVNHSVRAHSRLPNQLIQIKKKNKQTRIVLSWILSAKKQKLLPKRYQLRTSLGQSKWMTLKADIMSYLRFYI